MVVQVDVVRIDAGADGEWVRVYDFIREVTIALVPADPSRPPRSKATCFAVAR